MTLSIAHACQAILCTALLALSVCEGFATPSLLPQVRTASSCSRVARRPGFLSTRGASSPEPTTVGEAHSLHHGDVGRRELLRLLGGSALVAAMPKKNSAADSKGTVLVVGATGPIGRAVCQSLLSQGYKVRGITRKTKFVEAASQLPPDQWPSQVKWEVRDLAVPESLEGALKGVDKVVFCAGSQAYNGGIELNRKVYGDAVGTLVRLAKQDAKDLSSFVLLSSVGVTKYAAPGYPASEYLLDVLKWKANGEDLLRTSGLPYTICRFAFYSGEPVPTPNAIKIVQGDPNRNNGISVANIGVVMTKCLSDAKYNSRTLVMSEVGPNGGGGNWEAEMAQLKEDIKGAPLLAP
eukprot:CAMPEP_0173379258 /NCGR_PEP_ID=MMETSP1356-20130122/2280_1 /TAXON_ID=77927 ORGANISM="Hemiselmis virescens, Strain PCC157" /NCGR_SAMPLE_ID=MMETSP1356 /ASSEMBLY_ACC=CAM_ASM_000847 /LENGTH=350 /DNA_ID=CAMNT_0014332569 /DNA_START=58 /DNA_END=1110 /DNA_ORIENTATION=+